MVRPRIPLPRKVSGVSRCLQKLLKILKPFPGAPVAGGWAVCTHWEKEWLPEAGSMARDEAELPVWGPGPRRGCAVTRGKDRPGQLGRRSSPCGFMASKAPFPLSSSPQLRGASDARQMVGTWSGASGSQELRSHCIWQLQSGADFSPKIIIFVSLKIPLSP